MKLKIALLTGDGIGPEVTNQAVKVLKAIGKRYGHTFDFEEALVGAIAIDETGNPLPDETIAICESSDAVLFGAIGDPKYDNNPDAKVRPEQGLLKLRKVLGLYANIRPIKAYETLIDKSPLKRYIIEGTDMVIYRELTGGIYFGEKKLSDDGTVASDLCEYSQMEIERIAHLAFKSALTRRKKVTLVDKANVLETSRLWRRVVTNIAAEYPEVNLDFLFVDNAAMQMILNPKQFDVILTENLFGDIISDEGSVIGGSIGLLASASVGVTTDYDGDTRNPYWPYMGADEVTASPLALKLTLKALIEGFYANSFNDTISVVLSQTIAPYNKLAPVKGLTSASGVDFYLPKGGETSYYIVLKHRNSVETWSASTVATASFPLTYDFTSAAGQAYGSNMILVGGKWCIYGGDMSSSTPGVQDGLVDGSDLAAVDNDNTNFVTGYVVTDLTGEQIVDGSDLAIVDNNNTAFVGKVVPPGALTTKRIKQPLMQEKENK